jgi:hypothetical protein
MQNRRNPVSFGGFSSVISAVCPETSLVEVKKLGTVLKRPLQNAYLQLNASGAEGLSPIFGKHI